MASGLGEFGRIAVNVEAVYRELEPGYVPAGIVEHRHPTDSALYHQLDGLQ